MGHLIRTPGGALTPADDRMNVGCIVPPPAYFFFLLLLKSADSAAK